jgi:hypothetical protein
MSKLFGWFGPSRTEIWRKLSAQIGGSYSARTWRKSDRIQVEHEHWTITLDTFTVHANNAHIPYTRFRAPFLNTDAFRCKIYRAGFFSAVGKWLGMQDIVIGHEPFDETFIVKSNHEAKVRAFCQNPELRKQLAAQKSITLSVEDHEGWFSKFPADTDELRVVVHGHLKDTERLRALFALFATALDQLCAIGAAYERKPSLQL